MKLAILSSSTILLLLPALTQAAVPPPPPTEGGFALHPDVEYTNGHCANATYPGQRPKLGHVKGAIRTLKPGIPCASKTPAEGCNLIASYKDARISLCGYGEPQDCGGIIKQTAEYMVKKCKDRGVIGAWTSSRSGNGVSFDILVGD